MSNLVENKERWALNVNPMTLQHMKVMRLFLLTIGSWPDNHQGRKLPLLVNIQRKTLPGQVAMIVVGNAYYLHINRDSVDTFVVGHILITSLLSILMIARLTLPLLKGYGLILEEFMAFHLIHQKYKGSHYKETYEKMHKASHYFAIYEVIVMAASAGLFILTPLYNDYGLGRFQNPPPANVSYDYPIFFAYPGYKQDDHYYISTLIALYGSFNCGVCVCMNDLLITLMLFQIIGHIKILMLNMKTMARPSVIVDVTEELQIDNMRFDAEENEAVHNQLVDMIQHHRRIVSFADRMSNFFGPMLAFNFLYHLLSGCILLLECSSENTKEIARFGPLTVGVFGQLIQHSTVFEFVGYMSEKLTDSVYCMPWECMDVRNQRCVQILLQRVQTPINVTAMGIVPIGVRTMQAILKTTASFFAFLQTLG